jgi:hypothetical protein
MAAVFERRAERETEPELKAEALDAARKAREDAERTTPEG